MKILLICFLFFFCSCNCKSQIVGNFTGYSNGAYVFSFSNSGSCTASVRVSYSKGGLPKDTVIEVSSSSVLSVQAPYGSITDVKFKSDGQCSTTGWVSVVVSGTLPVYINSFRASSYKGKATVYYSLNWSNGLSDTVYLERSYSGNSFVPVHRIQPTETSYSEAVIGTAYYRIKIRSSVSSFYSPVAVAIGENEREAIVLYDMSGRFISSIPKGHILPFGSFLLQKDGKYQKVNVIQN